MKTFTSFIDHTAQEITELKNEISRKECNDLRTGLIDCIKKEKICSSEANTITLMLKIKTGLYAREIRSKCKAKIFFDQPWEKLAKTICEEAGTSRSTLENCIKLSTFDDCLDYKEIKVTKLISGVTTLIQYIDFENYQEEDELLKNSGVYVIKNVLQRIDPNKTSQKLMENICNAPKYFWSTYVINMNLKDSLGFVKGELNENSKLSYSDVKAIYEANTSGSININKIKDIINKNRKENKAEQAIRSLVSDKIRAVKDYAIQNNVDPKVVEGIETILLALMPTKSLGDKEKPVQKEPDQGDVPNAA